MKRLINLIVVALSFSACNYLDMVPENDIETIESVFETRQNAELWLNGTYAMANEILPDFNHNVAYMGADEFVACQALYNSSTFGGRYDLPGLRIAAGQQMSQNPYGDYWSRGNEWGNGATLYQTIRSCNTFLENIDRVYNMTSREKNEWAAEIKGLKAYCYFELVRRYGPITLVPENIDMEQDVTAMQLPRSHVDTCFNAIVQLCDEAAAVLPMQSEKSIDRRAYFSREAVLMLKAKALVYAASPLFNGNPFYSDFTGKEGELLFSTSVDPEKWRLAAEACDAAVEIAEAAGHELVSTTTAASGIRDYMDDIENSVLSDFNNNEMILEWKMLSSSQQGLEIYNLLLPRVNVNVEPGNAHFNSFARGALSPSMKMVEMYYTENGLPIDMDNTWNYSGRYIMSQEADNVYNTVVPLHEDVLQLHLRREPRFYACIAADRTYWQRGPSNSTTGDNLLVTAYKDEYFGSQFDYITSTGDQNINGYWCKKHLNSGSATTGYAQSQDHTMPLMRLAELYLMQAEAWNEYEGPSEKVYNAIDKVRERAGIPDVVTAWESYSREPEKVKSKEGMREIIHRETDIELAFEGARFFNLRRWLTAHETLNEKQMGWNILGTTASQFYNNWNGPIVVWSQVGFSSPRDYLFPINAEEVLRSSIVQNPGW